MKAKHRLLSRVLHKAAKDGVNIILAYVVGPLDYAMHYRVFAQYCDDHKEPSEDRA
ncbi:MAG: hypothetical protein M3329_05380 [Pseudomonadota bacterium]|nr:hypothetical protein [Pseudomonadota bacterium]